MFTPGLCKVVLYLVIFAFANRECEHHQKSDMIRFGRVAFTGEYAEVFDECIGHPQQNGAYHYHHIPVCLLEAGQNDQLLGVALDGMSFILTD